MVDALNSVECKIKLTRTDGTGKLRATSPVCLYSARSNVKIVSLGLSKLLFSKSVSLINVEYISPNGNACLLL